MKTKFNIGDKVEIINYGSLMMVRIDTYRKQHAFMTAQEQEHLHLLLTGEVKVFQPITNNHVKPDNIIEEKNGFFIYDTDTELVGQQGIIEKATITQNLSMYSIKGIKGKCAWYYDSQLKMINKNPNNE